MTLFFYIVVPVDNITPNGMNNNNNMVQPLPQHQQQQQQQQQSIIPENSSEQDKAIYHKNNLRLQQMEREIRVFLSYGMACDELLKWLNDDRAYNKINESALLGCIIAIHEVHVEHGRWSGLQILKLANEKCAGLSEKGRGKKKKEQYIMYTYNTYFYLKL